VEDESSQIQALFSFNTTEAQQMLTAAGYPKGFTTSITIDSAYSQEADEATIIAADWAKVGVTVKIIQINTTALAEERDNDSYTGLICFPVFTDSSTTPLAWYQGNTLGGEYKTGEPLDIEANSALQEEDPAKQQTDVTQFCKDAILDCGIIGMPNPYVINCYWPWLRNYYGEIDAAYHNQVPMISELWIDQTLKTSDGYR
jgi:peptide/nickel transport system substrate-binding protein